MINIYKKVNKTITNTYGILEIKNINDLNKPFLLCLSGSDTYDKAIFGTLRAGCQAARCCTTKEGAAGFILDEVPIDFITVKFKSDDNYKNSYDEIAQELIFPFLFNGDDELESISRRARMINIFTFDKGAFVYKNIEKKLILLLSSAGYSDDDVFSILSQISLTVLATDISLDEVNANCVVINDVNDVHISCKDVVMYHEVLSEVNAPIMYLPYVDKNSIYLSFLGSGDHNINSYFLDSCIAKPIICSVISYALENSLQNVISDEFKKIDFDSLLQTIYHYDAYYFNCTVEHLVKCLDEWLSYCDSPRFTPNEVLLRKQSADLYKLLRKQNTYLENRENEKNELENKINNLVKAIRKYSSDITYHQILTEAGLWFESSDILKVESDRLIRDKYDNCGKNDIKIGTNTKSKNTKSSKSTSKTVSKTTTKKSKSVKKKNTK